MLRMTQEEYEEHQKRVRELPGPRIVNELERAAGWTRSKDPKVQAGGREALAAVSNLLAMDQINRHKPTVGANGEHYDSKGEARRHQILAMREKAGLIRDLKHHPEPVDLVVGGVKVGTWQPDFAYLEQWTELERGRDRWRLVWEDFKGFTSRKSKAGKTQVNPAWRAFKFKAKIIGALYPNVTIRVITRDKLML